MQQLPLQSPPLPSSLPVFNQSPRQKATPWDWVLAVSCPAPTVAFHHEMAGVSRPVVLAGGAFTSALAVALGLLTGLPTLKMLSGAGPGQAFRSRSKILAAMAILFGLALVLLAACAALVVSKARLALRVQRLAFMAHPHSAALASPKKAKGVGWANYSLALVAPSTAIGLVTDSRIEYSASHLGSGAQLWLVGALGGERLATGKCSVACLLAALAVYCATVAHALYSTASTQRVKSK